MRRLRIAYLPAALQAGGAEKQMLALAEGLPRDRYAVDFLPSSGIGEYDARARSAGARVRPIGTLQPQDVDVATKLWRRAIKTTRYVAIARATRYDIVDAWLYPADVLAALARPFTRTPIVIAGRRNLGDVDTRLGRLDRFVGLLSGRLIDAVVANSAAVANEALSREGIDPTKLRIIRNGVHLIEPVSPRDRASRRRLLGVSDDEILIGCVANYRPVKRLDLLIETFASLQGQQQRLRLVLVGEGEMRNDLERRIRRLGLEGRVTLHGWELDPGLLYGLFDLVVQTSRSEGLPNAMLEAAAAGAPIIATAAGGTGEIVLDGQTGLLVPVDDGVALAAALQRAIADTSLRLRLGAAARDHVAKTFGMDRYVAEFASLYEELAATKHLPN